MDNRGYSESGKPRGIENYQIHLMVDDLRDLIHGLGRTSCIMVNIIFSNDNNLKILVKFDFRLAMIGVAPSAMRSPPGTPRS